MAVNTDSYGTNEHAYRVFNKTTGVVETTVDVKFDESNGSQVEQVDMNLVDDEEPSISIMRMGLGEVKPREEGSHAMVEARNEDPSSSTRVESPSSQVPQDQGHAHGDDHDHGIDQGAQGEETQEEAPQAQNDDNGEPIQP